MSACGISVVTVDTLSKSKDAGGMKKILFFIPNLSVGGAEKVLVNLVNNMDRSRFDVTVQTLFAGGVNEQFLNKNNRYKYFFRKNFKGNSQVQTFY